MERRLEVYLCWKRAETAWLGSMDAPAPREATWHVDFEIKHGVHALEWTAKPVVPDTWFAESLVMELTASGHDLAIFGSPKPPVDRVLARDPLRDALIFQPTERLGPYRLAHTTDPAP